MKTNTTMTGTGDMDFSRFTSTKLVEGDVNRDNLQERKKKHLESVDNLWKSDPGPCAHDNCPECIGTGRKSDGSFCIHMISCPCKKCSPHCV